ncbi:hypothetical protein ES332_D03G173800v1 [Gossypium tomentosum]|uniref:Uncharacterized protein n=1 Tax=Gossypium tomentosum TaxID=34277 RepID=A0A5D2LR48_GOSTO|nr:hypothetical protein ES332_D03G173800v1 [Gossypium tomentosum]
MGTRLSITKVGGGGLSSNTTAQHRKEQQPSAATTATNAEKQVRCSQPLRNKQKPSTRKQSGIIPWGKRTDFRGTIRILISLTRLGNCWDMDNLDTHMLP